MTSMEFVRAEPQVSPAGDAAEYQISDAYDARWVAPLSNGTFAVVTRTYYIADFEGRVFVERRDEYLVCRDPSDPGSTEIGSKVVHAEVDSSDPAGEDPFSLARSSFPPDVDEWREKGPSWAHPG